MRALHFVILVFLFAFVFGSNLGMEADPLSRRRVKNKQKKGKAPSAMMSHKKSDHNRWIWGWSNQVRHLRAPRKGNVPVSVDRAQRNSSPAQLARISRSVPPAAAPKLPPTLLSTK
jgi:hypothetical protein